MRIATNLTLVIAGLLLTVATPVSAGSPVAPIDLGAECEAILATLPDTAAKPETAGWPHHDPLLDAMVPDVIAGEAVWHFHEHGTRPDPHGVPAAIALAAGREPADYRGVQAVAEDLDNLRSGVSAVRVTGAGSRSTLDALLAGRIGSDSPPDCSATSIDGQAVLRVSGAYVEAAALMPFGDAWLVISDATDDVVDELAAHLADLAITGVVQPPVDAPVAGTRISPPASAAALATALPRTFAGKPFTYLGEVPGQLGVGMVPVRLLGAFDLLQHAVAAGFGADLDELWGDMGESDAPGPPSPAVTMTVLADPTGDGSRWVDAYLDVRLDRDTLLPDPSAPLVIPVGTLTTMDVGGKPVTGGGSDTTGWFYLYASGPWFFTIRADTAAHGAEVLASLP